MNLTSNNPGLLLLGAIWVLSGCAQFDAFIQPAGDDHGFYGAPYRTESHIESHPGSHSAVRSKEEGLMKTSASREFYCQQRATGDVPGGLLKASMQQSVNGAGEVPFSPGDLLELNISHDEDFSGQYVIDATGHLRLPFVQAVAVAGMGVSQATRQIERALVKAGMLLPGVSQLSLQVLQWAPIEVSVAGAVFEPGRVKINNPSAEVVMQERTRATGDYTSLRSVSEALRAASGIRPDADLQRVVVIRKGWQHELDLRGIVSGHLADDFVLTAGDSIFVPSTGCFQPALVRPTQITPKGFRVFMSNLIVPASDNSSGAVGRYSTNLPYGTRLLQAAVSANCVGGVQSTNASRKVVLASQNPLTSSTEVVERSVEVLLRAPYDEIANPYLMPNDAVACYDSAVTNLRDIARTISDLIAPARLL